MPDDPAERPIDDISHVGLLRTILVLNVVILIGYALEEVVAETGIKLPLFVVCLLVGIVVTNTVPRMFPRIEWPTRTRALALVSDLSLNVFLAMSLMSMQLWTLGGLGPALVVVLAAQTIAAVAYILFVVFPVMGRNYEAAVISAGFTGISLGATPTAIANMTAVTKVHGACARDSLSCRWFRPSSSTLRTPSRLVSWCGIRQTGARSAAAAPTGLCPISLQANSRANAECVLRACKLVPVQ